MSNSPMSKSTSEDAEYEAAIEKIFIEIEREVEQMKQGRKEFERSKARTLATLDSIHREIMRGVEDIQQGRFTTITTDAELESFADAIIKRGQETREASLKQ